MRDQELMEVTQRRLAVLICPVSIFAMDKCRGVLPQRSLHSRVGLEEFGQLGTLSEVIGIVDQRRVLSQLSFNGLVSIQELVEISQLRLRISRSGWLLRCAQIPAIRNLCRLFKVVL